MSKMNLSQCCLDLIKKWEGFVPIAEPCPAGYPTFGWGSRYDINGQAVKNGDIISKQEAEELLRYECKSYSEVINQCVTVPLNQNQFDALVSFTFNVGPNAFKGSTLLRELNKKNYSGAAEQFLVWNKITKNGQLIPLQGLTNRRKDEKALFEKQGGEEKPFEPLEPSLQHQVSWLEGYREADNDNTVIVAYSDSKVVEILVIKSPAKADLISVLQQYPNAKNFLLASPGKKVPDGDRLVIQPSQAAIINPLRAEEIPSLQNSLLVIGMGADDNEPVSVKQDIEHLQKRLMALGYYTGPIDGHFGTGTNSAVKAFQSKEFGEAEADGKVGSITWGKLWPQEEDDVTPVTGKTYLKLTKTNSKLKGLYQLKLDYIKNGQLKDSMLVCSGVASRQFFRTGPNSKAGSLEPLPEGKWSIQNIKWAGGKDNYYGKTFAVKGNGVGPVSTPVEYVGPKTTGRSAIEIHIDWNRSPAPGTAGCVGMYTIADYQRFVRWLRETDPKDLYVDWGLGTCPKP
jgi:lysozyme